MTVAEMLSEIDSIIGEHHDRFINDREKIKWLNRAYHYYYLWIINAFESHFVTFSLINWVANQRAYALPADFLKAKLVERVLSTGTVPLNKLTRNQESNYTLGAASQYLIPTYDFEGQNIVFEPTPESAETGAVRLTYIQTLTDLAVPTDTPNAGFSSPYHALLPLRAAVSSGLANKDTKQEMADLEQLFRETLEMRSMSRQHTYPFGLDTENES